jgi:hypothetical protein
MGVILTVGIFTGIMILFLILVVILNAVIPPCKDE